jgi:hypothetical protein
MTNTDFELNVLISLAKLCEMQVRRSGDNFVISDLGTNLAFCSDFEGCKAFLLGVRFVRRE